MTAGNVHGWYEALRQPPGTPPNWVFAPVWTVLYLTLGVSAWLVWRRVEIGAHRKRAALRVWGWHLLLNSIWPSAFFGLHSPGLGMTAIVLLLGGAALTLRAFLPLERRAAWLMVPYLGWVCYACYLNAGFLLLNGT